MSMHLVGHYLNDIGNSKKKPSKSKKLAAANAEHDKWLRDRGLHPEQRELKRAFVGKEKIAMPDYKTNNPYKLSNNIAIRGGFKNGIMDNLHKESKEVQQAIRDKAARTTMAYNKGPSMYFSPEADTTMLGSSSRRG